MELQTETVKPAEAARDARVAGAEAKARETELDAAANAKRVEIEAGANAKKVALEKNNEAVIAQTLAEKAPELVRAAAESFRGIDNLTVLNGAEGITGMAGEVMKLGLGIMPLVQQTLGNGNGANKKPKPDEEAEPKKT